MPTVFDVAIYILERIGKTTTLKLQKLIYYSQAWSIAWGDGPLFRESIEAWDQGPVVRELWEAHRGRYHIELGDLQGSGSQDALASTQYEDIDAVLHVYGSFTPEELSDMSHREEPWTLARQRRSRITPASLRGYYRGLDVAREPLKAEGTFLLKTMLAKITPLHQPNPLDWGEPVGAEKEPW